MSLTIAADLSIISNGENLGQYPDLKAKGNPICDQVTRAELIARRTASPELAPAIDEILKADFPLPPGEGEPSKRTRKNSAS